MREETFSGFSEGNIILFPNIDMFEMNSCDVGPTEPVRAELVSARF